MVCLNLFVFWLVVIGFQIIFWLMVSIFSYIVSLPTCALFSVSCIEGI